VKGDYLVNADALLLKSFKNKVTKDDKVLRTAVKIKLLKSYVEDEPILVNKSLALSGLFSYE
tara:strand:- start:17 stop:202 length:186 start_codon:yes stop_codon:yes gene_type:complete